MSQNSFNVSSKTLKAASTKPHSHNIIPCDSDDSLNNYIRKISSIAVLSPEEEKQIAQIAKEGSEKDSLKAKQQLVQANLKLVVNIARKTVQVSHLPMIDLIQEGNLGLMVAVEKFDYKLGYRFSTYAAWWIKQAIFKAISEQSHCVKIPVYIQETLSKFSKVKSSLEQKYNTQVKNEDVAKTMNISAEKIDMFLGAYTKSISMDSAYELNSGNEVTLSDILEDPNASVYADAEYENLKKDIETVVSKLKEREQAVVKMRFGLGEWSKTTLEEIGKLYGVTKECIRQTEARALKKLRDLTETNNLLTAYMY
ncbi:MAG TPA: RNA polymerase sigma factor RpoD/SigA [Candidatus Limenecus avicola]|uniref:RNA polymerase sigma factor RpoD/SigA n=1 Tax=Candidatus Limenecus avicola TaxID=2840847 RepID=A0A9D1N182_9CLOT|nr:RNA polymerase sigma factor RpoD/SigA [Candidatus Limenecus avicola]